MQNTYTINMSRVLSDINLIRLISSFGLDQLKFHYHLNDMMLQVNACMSAYSLINYFNCNSVLVIIGPTSRIDIRDIECFSF